jgi:Domain of unknown function (DUF4349)
MFIPAAAIVATLALAGCSATSGASDTSGGSVSVENAPELSRDSQSTEFVQTDTVATPDRQVVTTGYVTITVEKPMDAAAEAIRITEQSGGRVDGRTETAPINGNEGSATLTLRIPSDTLTTTLDKLRKLGAVQEVSLNSSDVTMATQDLDARIKALTASIDRLLGLLATATDTENLITLETAISDRQTELESLESQRRYYADQVSLSTVTLNLVSDFTAPVAEPDNFFSGLVAGWNAFVAFFAGLLVALGVALPWLVFLGAIAVIVVVLVKRRAARPQSAIVEAANPIDAP